MYVPKAAVGDCTLLILLSTATALARTAEVPLVGIRPYQFLIFRPVSGNY